MKELSIEELRGLNRFIIDCNSQGLKIILSEGFPESTLSSVAYECVEGHEGVATLTDLVSYNNSCPQCWRVADEFIRGGA